MFQNFRSIAHAFLIYQRNFVSGSHLKICLSWRSPEALKAGVFMFCIDVSETLLSEDYTSAIIPSTYVN